MRGHVEGPAIHAESVAASLPGRQAAAATVPRGRRPLRGMDEGSALADQPTTPGPSRAAPASLTRVSFHTWPNGRDASIEHRTQGVPTGRLAGDNGRWRC